MRVQPDMLRAAASALRGAGAAITVVASNPATALPLAPDPASTAAIARLNTYAKGLVHVLGQGGNRLQFLNFKLGNDATTYETTDEANSDLINSSVGLGGSGAGSTGGGGTGGAPSAPAQSPAPETLGGLSPVPPLAEPGETFAALLESAPGSSALSEYFTALKSVLDALTFGHPLITKGKGMVTEGWDTSDSTSDPASAATQSISRMSDWSTNTTAYTNSLHQAATNTQSAFETLKATHPTTTEYAAANAQIQAGQTMITSAAASMNPVALVSGYMTLQQGVTEKAALDTRATAAQTTYSSTLQSATNLPTQLPSINSGGYSPAGGANAAYGDDGQMNAVNSSSGTNAYSGSGDAGSSYGSSGSGYNASPESSYGSGGPGGSSAGGGGQGDPSSLGSQSPGSGYSPGADPGLSDGTGMNGGDGSALGGGGYAPFAPGGLAGLAGGGGGAFGGGTPSFGSTGRLIGQSGLAATPEATTTGNGLSAQQGKIAAVPTAGQKAGATPMMPMRGAGGAGAGGKDKERERDKALNPDIQVDDDTEYGPAVLGVQPRKRVASTSLPSQDAS